MVFSAQWWAGSGDTEQREDEIKMNQNKDTSSNSILTKIAVGLILLIFLVVMLSPYLLKIILSVDNPKTYRMVCLSNIRCIGQMLIIYANEHKGKVPVGPMPKNGIPDASVCNTNVSFGALYIQNNLGVYDKTFLCPRRKTNQAPKFDIERGILVTTPGKITPEGQIISYALILARDAQGNKAVPLFSCVNDDPPQNSLLMDDPGSDGDVHSFGKKDNHSTDGYNIFRCDGNVQWVSDSSSFPYNQTRSGEPYLVDSTDLIRQVSE